jgi:L-iditol 2-dehydrogenase
MKVAVLHSFNDIRIEDWPVPEVEKGEALIKMKACGICSGDVMPWYIEKKAPLVLGHEPAGQIVALGDGVTDFQIGDPVFVHHHAPCMSCHYCSRGDYVQCDTWKRSRIVPGGLAEYVKIPAINLRQDTLKLPPEVDYLAGTLVEPLACVVKGMRRLGVKPGDKVLIIGLGVMGALFVAAARHMGASKVVGMDMVPYRLKKALEIGAHEVVDVSRENAGGRLKELFGDGRGGEGDSGADRVVVGPGNVSAMAQGISCATPGATVLFFTPTPPGEILQIEPNKLYFKEITIVQSYSCGPEDTREALRLLLEEAIPMDKIITHKFPLKDAGEAFRLTAKAGESLKAVVVFE